MPYVPPWLNVQPSDFLRAAEAGSRVGAQLAAISEREQAAAARSQAQEAVAGSRIAAQSAIANARLAEQERAQEANRQMREFELTQKMKMGEDALSSQEERAADALKQRTSYESGLLDLRKAANDIAQQRADIAADKAGSTTDKMSPLDTHMLSDALVRRRQAQEEISKASESVASGGAPTRQMLSKLRAAQADIDSITKKYSSEAPATETATSQSASPAITEGQRVRSKSTGKTGTVTGGKIVWDDEVSTTRPDQVDGKLNMLLPGSRGFGYFGAE